MSRFLDFDRNPMVESNKSELDDQKSLGGGTVEDSLFGVENFMTHSEIRKKILHSVEGFEQKKIQGRSAMILQNIGNKKFPGCTNRCYRGTCNACQYIGHSQTNCRQSHKKDGSVNS